VHAHVANVRIMQADSEWLEDLVDEFLRGVTSDGTDPPVTVCFYEQVESDVGRLVDSKLKVSSVGRGGVVHWGLTGDIGCQEGVAC